MGIVIAIILVLALAISLLTVIGNEAINDSIKYFKENF
jgi:hypothetical protein